MEKSIREYIEELDLSNEEAYNQLYKIFTKKCPMPVLTVPILANSGIYRSRTNHPGADFTNFRDLSYPPKNIITEYSRANKPSEQIFYASDKYEISILELLPYWPNLVDVGETIAVTTGIWQLDSDILVGIIPDFKNSELMKYVNSSQYSNALNSDRDDLNSINQYFRGQGFYDKNIYKVTSAYCKAVIHNIESNGDNVQGLLYTSVQHSTGWNIALNPQVVNDHLQLVSVIKHFIRKNHSINGKPSYDNFQTPIEAKRLDKHKSKIIW